MNDRDRLRVGMLGVGGVAASYTSLYAEYPRSELVTVYDVSPESGQNVANAHGCTIASSVEEVMNADIDAVVISTPNFLHFDQTSQALAAGKHVLLQKPMTLNAEEASALEAQATAAGRHLAMYMNSLDNPVIRDLKQMVADGFFGRLGSINAKLANGRGMSWKGQSNFWRGSKLAVGGGSFSMLATHYVNLCQWMLDQPIVEVTAFNANLLCDHIEGDDIMSSIVRFADNSIGVIESAWCVKGEQFSMHGSEGSAAYIDNSVLTVSGSKAFSGHIIKYNTPGERIVIDGLKAPAMGDWQNPFNQHRQFVDAILDGVSVPVPGGRGVQDMLVLEAAYASVESKTAITIPTVK